MSAHDDDGSRFDDDIVPTMIDPEVPTGVRDRPAMFDPTARLKDNRRSLPPQNARSFVPPVIPMTKPPAEPLPVRPPRQAAGFDPHVRIDDNSRTVQVDAGTGPMRVISMKTPGQGDAAKHDRAIPEVKLRALSEIHQTPARGMGNLAAPYDPQESRSRRRLDHVIWASAAVIVASIVTLAIWFLSRR
ncbi:MAG: hypothetical protein JWP01_1780 [Myxococcales bacterium]|nr:hypothetical protein [Myxococcales bacterium]